MNRTPNYILKYPYFTTQAKKKPWKICKYLNIYNGDYLGMIARKVTLSKNTIYAYCTVLPMVQFFFKQKFQRYQYECLP